MRIIVCISILLLSNLINAQNYEIDTIFYNGHVDKRVNIVILGDGYMEHELGKFSQDVVKINNDLFKEAPFDSYKSYFNVFAIKVPSNVSGAATHPSMLIDNFFGSSFNVGGIERLLVPMRSWKVTELLATHLPQYDQVIMIVNDTKYGGSGGWLATSSTHNSASEITIHEIGHSFSKLSDEYFAGDQYLRETANMTRTSHPDSVRWKNWMGQFGIGIYQHCCGGNSANWYRPHQDCKMRYLGRAFCSVCKETTIARIHHLTNPIDHFLPNEPFIEMEEDTIIFSVDLVKPDPNTLQLKWLLEDTIIDQSESQLSLSKDMLVPGQNRLVFEVVDTTQSIRIDNYKPLILRRIEWKIEELSTGWQVAAPKEDKISFAIYPNPSSDLLYIEFEQIKSGEALIHLHNLEGQLIKSYRQPISESGQVQMALPQEHRGMLILKLSVNGKPYISSKILKLGN
jgi:hypothetical protein